MLETQINRVLGFHIILSKVWYSHQEAQEDSQFSFFLMTPKSRAKFQIKTVYFESGRHYITTSCHVLYAAVLFIHFKSLVLV